jgi:hypothetical protein
MDPALQARYEDWLVQLAIRTTVFWLVTYVPLQAVALWRCTGWKRLAASLPLLPMAPILIAGANPNAHRDGSLYGMYVLCPFVPVALYLVGLLIDPRKNRPCPHCGYEPRVRSFQIRRLTGPCPKCGKSLDEPVTEQPLAG